MILSAECPEGWAWKPEYGKCYYVINQPKTWYKANEMCVALDPDNKATLTSIRSKEENDYVQSISEVNSYWLGGNDITEEGVWRWANLNFCIIIMHYS